MSADSSGSGIIRNLIQFIHATTDRPSGTPKDTGHILDPAMSKLDGLERRIPSSVLLGKRAEEVLHLLFNFRAIRLKLCSSHPWPPILVMINPSISACDTRSTTFARHLFTGRSLAAVRRASPSSPATLLYPDRCEQVQLFGYLLMPNHYHLVLRLLVGEI